jgi:hypothetical protein
VRLAIPIIKASDDDTHWLSLELNDSVVVFYMDDKELFKTDLENIEELVDAVGLLWLDWRKLEGNKEA